MKRRRSSRHRYRSFVEDYRRRRLDDQGQAQKEESAPPEKSKLKRREYLREYLRWLWPHRWAVGALFALALIIAGLQMVEPLFLRFIVDRVLLNSRLDSASRFRLLNGAGALFLGLVVASNLVSAFREYRQRLVNIRVTLGLRRTLYERLLHLPLPKLWDMKTGGILSRISGDVDTTTGLLQMALVSPSVSVIRLAVAIGILTALNWRLALTALALIPGIMAVSFVFANPRGARVPARGQRAVGFHARPPHRAAQGDVRAAPRNRDLDHVEPDHGRRERRDCVVRRLPQPAWRRVDRRHHGVPVVHIPAAESGVEHCEYVLGAAAVAGRDGAGLRGPRDGGRQARPAWRHRRAADCARDTVRGSGVRISRGTAGGPRFQRDGSGRIGGRAGRAQRRRQDDGHGPGGALSRSQQGTNPAQRGRHSRIPSEVVPRTAGTGAAGRVPVRRVGAGQHRIRPARRRR